MGSLFPTIGAVIASSTADSVSLAGYVTLPVISITFAVAVVIAATLLVKKLLVGGVRRATGTGSRRGRGRRR